MFPNRYRYLFISILAGYSYVNSLLSSVYVSYKINAPGYYVLLTFFLITFFVWEGNRIIGAKLQSGFSHYNPNRLLIIFFGIGVLFSILITALIFYLIGIVVVGLPVSESRIPAILALTYGTRINLFLHILNAVFFYNNQLKNKQLEAEELKRINSQAQLQAIKNQVNPHFLFNNLNVLSMLVLQENKDANQFIEEFSKVYRHILNAGQQELIPLKEELAFADAYFYLLERRFPDSIFLIKEIPAGFEDYHIVPVSVQMLIENAIKHNVISKSRPLRILIRPEGADRLLVENNLQIKSATEPWTQIGLKNIDQRYQIITKRKIEIIKTDEHFAVLLPLILPTI